MSIQHVHRIIRQLNSSSQGPCAASSAWFHRCEATSALHVQCACPVCTMSQPVARPALPALPTAASQAAVAATVAGPRQPAQRQHEWRRCERSSALPLLVAAGGAGQGVAGVLPATVASLGLHQWRTMACSAGLGRAPPKVITIEYDPNDVDAFIEIADAIEEAFPKVIVSGNEEREGRPGAFEVSTDDGVSLFSRLKATKADTKAAGTEGRTTAIPSPQDILDRIVNRAKLVPGSMDEVNKPFCG